MAEEVKQLLDEDYPDARKVKRLCDNSQHASYSLALGSLTEIKLSVLHQQCLKRCIGEPLTLAKELAAWQ